MQCGCHLDLDLDLDVDVEGGAVLGAIQRLWRTEFVDLQARDEGLRAPTTKVRVSFKPGFAGESPERSIILVVAAVSSRMTIQCGSRRILGIRRCRHSVAISELLHQAKALDQVPREHGGGWDKIMHLHPKF